VWERSDAQPHDSFLAVWFAGTAQAVVIDFDFTALGSNPGPIAQNGVTVSFSSDPANGVSGQPGNPDVGLGVNGTINNNESLIFSLSFSAPIESITFESLTLGELDQRGNGDNPNIDLGANPTQTFSSDSSPDAIQTFDFTSPPFTQLV